MTIHRPSGTTAGLPTYVVEHVRDRPSSAAARRASLDAAPSGWTWLSYRPGSTTLPPASMTRVFGPFRRNTVVPSPVSKTRPPRTATADAMENAASTVSTLALWMMRSADGGSAALDTRQQAIARRNRT